MKTLCLLLILAFVIKGGLRMFGIRTSINLLPSFQAGEKVVFFKKWVWLGSMKSLPSYRLWPSLPPIVEHGMYVTQRRVLHVFHIFRLLRQELSQCFDEKDKSEYGEFMKEVNVGKSWLFGPYLEIVSECPTKSWWRSSELRLRLFMGNPESVRRVIAEEVTRNREFSEHPNKREVVYQKTDKRDHT